MKKVDALGCKYGRLTVIELLPSRVSGVNNKKKKRWVKCACDCGNHFETVLANLIIGNTASCGCYKKASIASVNYKHGDCNSPEYNTWSSMLSRCYCKTDRKYPIYGGRGITICDKWRLSYENFLHDMGRRPEGCNSIDRLNVNGNYEPSNCIWSNPKEQANNKRANVNLTHDGVTLTMSQWAERLEINYKTFHRLIRYKNQSLSEIISNGRVSSCV